MIIFRIIAALALVAWTVCHLGLIVGLLMRRRWLQSALSAALPPLAVHWGWDMKRRARGWLIAVGAYAVALTVLRVVD